MGRIFLGKPSHWALWLIIGAVLFGAGRVHMHVRWFGDFVLLLLALAAGAVLFVVLGYRKGDVITREPFDAPQPPGPA